jgi:tetratricopeptide (TPR) repeat protein
MATPLEAAPEMSRHVMPLTESTPARLASLARGFQRELARNPRDARALIALALVALAGRQTEPAVRLAQAATAAAPNLAAAHVALGQVLRASGRLDSANDAFETALGLDPVDPLALAGLAEVDLAAGRVQQAMVRYRIVLGGHPGLAPALLGLGHALGCAGHFEEALPLYYYVLAQRPGMAEAHFAAAFALNRLRRVSEAESGFRRAIALRPGFAAAWVNLGCLLREQGRMLEAERALCEAVQLRPDVVSGWLNLALLALDASLLDRAASHLRRAIALDRVRPETHLAWARLCLARRDFAGAHEWVRWALAQDPNNDEAHNMLGILLHSEGRFAEAVPAFARAEALGSLPAISNRGNSLLDLGQMEDALAAHQSAVDHEPDHAGARYNLALTQLRLGHWREGWRNYEARWRFREVHRQPRIFSELRWQGELLSGERVLLHAEQGLGDTIQFCRYATLVAARGGRPILQVQAAVARLLHSLAVVRGGLAEIALLQDPQPPCDLECPLMSLPAVFGTAPETVPWPGAYLAPIAEADESEDRKLFRSGVRQSAPSWPPIPDPCSLSVGIAWSGNPRYKADAQRSVHLRELIPLLRAPGVAWISLQKGPAADQMAELPDGVGLIDGSSRDRDLADTALTIAHLDAVVTTDTSIAHLAGAMGKPVFILLPHLADWRWMQDASTTPWYPTARLFRQPVRGDWASGLAAVTTALKALACAKPPVPHVSGWLPRAMGGRPEYSRLPTRSSTT